MVVIKCLLNQATRGFVYIAGFYCNAIRALDVGLGNCATAQRYLYGYDVHYTILKY